MKTCPTLQLLARLLGRASIPTAVFLVATASGLRSAAAETVVITVPAEVGVVQALRYADGGGQCVNSLLGVWTDVPGTLSAILRYTTNGTPGATGASPPYANEGQAEGPGSAGFPAALPGTSRIEIGFNAAAGPAPTREEFKADCDDLASKLSAGVSSVATVELTIPRPNPAVISSISGDAKLNSKRQAAIGRITCPTGGSCTVTAPTKVRVTIADKKYSLTVASPTTVEGGSAQDVTVTFPRAASDALKGRKVTVSLKLTANNRGLNASSKTVKRKVKGKK